MPRRFISTGGICGGLVFVAVGPAFSSIFFHSCSCPYPFFFGRNVLLLSLLNLKGVRLLFLEMPDPLFSFLGHEM